MVSNSSKWHYERGPNYLSDTSFQSDPYYSGADERRPLTSNLSVPAWRWYVLGLYCAISFFQVVVWNTWSPITNSVLFAYPTWSINTIALLSNWGCISFIMFIAPSCWMLNKFGLRKTIITASVLCTLGCGIRLVNFNETVFTIAVHTGAILNAISGVLLSPAVLLLSTTWFPAHQRTSATGIGTSLSLLGWAASYVIGPFLVPEPSQLSIILKRTEQRLKIQSEITYLSVMCFFVQFFLCILTIFTFPEKPLTPPSRVSLVHLTKTYGFGKSLRILSQNIDFWTLSFASALGSGMTGPWLSLITITFTSTGLSQNETASIGFWTVLCSSLLGLSVSRVSDIWPGHIKTMLLCLVAVADAMFLWLMFLMKQEYRVNKISLILAVIAGVSCVWSTPALYYELGAELGYPIPPGIIAGCMMCLNNSASCIVYFQLFLFPEIGTSWMNYGLFICGTLSFFVLLLVRVNYQRLQVDKRNPPSPGYHNSSSGN